MPSFDIVSEIDVQEVRNAVDNASREVGSRWDFRNVTASIEWNDKQNTVKVCSGSDFQVNQLLDILRDKCIKRGIASTVLAIPEQIEHSGKLYSMEIKFKQGIDSLLAKQIIKLIKDKKLKVQAQIQGEQVRVTGKARDDLQQVINLLKQAELGQPLQFINFRD